MLEDSLGFLTGKVLAFSITVPLQRCAFCIQKERRGKVHWITSEAMSYVTLLSSPRGGLCAPSYYIFKCGMRRQ
jgi:hypothetical protein